MPNSWSDDGHSWEINYGNVPQLLNRLQVHYIALNARKLL